MCGALECRSVFNKDESYDCDCDYVISAGVMDLIQGTTDVSDEIIYKAMLDSGANVNVITYQLTMRLGCVTSDIEAGRQIRTAEKTTSLNICGWIDVGGYIGMMAVVKQASFSLLAIGVL